MVLGGGTLACMEGKVDMGARGQVTGKLRGAYLGASKVDKGRVLDQVVAATGVGRSTARRLLVGPVGRGVPAGDRVDGRSVRARLYGDSARELLARLWRLMGCPCGPYLVVMLPQWVPLLAAAGDLGVDQDSPVVGEVLAMSANTVDRYLRPVKDQMRLQGISATKPGRLLRNSIAIRKCTDELELVPGMLEVDTVAHCGPSLRGEFVRTLTMTDMHTGWTLCASVRNNAAKWIVAAVARLRDEFPFPVTGFDSDNGSEFINYQVARWLQERDIAFTRSRPYKKNDQATVESKNNHVVRKSAFYYRYDNAEELVLLNQLWELVELRLNFFTPTRKPVGYASSKTGHRKRLYDKPKTPWQRVQDSITLTSEQKTGIETKICDVNPADLTRRINTIQNDLIQSARDKTHALTTARQLDLTQLEPSIRKLQPAN